MPRALLRDILFEKKKNLKYPTQGEFYAKLDILKSSCLNLMVELNAVKDTLAGNKSEYLDKVISDVKGYMELIGKMRADKEKYQWNDESVQDMVDKLESNIQNSFSEAAKSRQGALGKNDALKFADDYFYLAESLKLKGNQVLFNLASIEKQSKKAQEFKKNTDPFQENTMSDQLDIVAKKGIEKKEGESDDDFKKRAEDQKKLDELRKNGIIKLIASLLGVTYEEIYKGYTEGSDGKDKLATRVDMYNEVMPFVEAVSGRKYERCEAKEGKGVFDPQFISDLSVLAEYRGYYSEKYYKSSRPKEGEKEKEEDLFSEEEYKKIEEKMKTIKGELDTLLENLKKNNTGEDDKGKKRDSEKNKQMVELVDDAKTELDKIELKYACSPSNLKSMESDKQEFDKNLKKYESFLDAKDKEIIGEMIKKLEKIKEFCSGLT